SMSASTWRSASAFPWMSLMTAVEGVEAGGKAVVSRGGGKDDSAPGTFMKPGDPADGWSPVPAGFMHPPGAIGNPASAARRSMIRSRPRRARPALSRCPSGSSEHASGQRDVPAHPRDDDRRAAAREPDRLPRGGDQPRLRGPGDDADALPGEPEAGAGDQLLRQLTRRRGG